MTNANPRFTLPVAPTDLTSAVKAWSEPVTIPTYLPQLPDKNPMFLEKRVYQGSSGKIYPLPFYDRISGDKIDHAWQALHIENEFVRVMILPQIGGRIHVALDKTNGYDFVYRQNVIKPALVGLAGPWISGGIEFNWPQHHRPGTFMPADWVIENHADGSVTIWLSEHDPLNRLKGMHGVCLHPGRSYIELKVRLYNRTSLTQTFLWWANVATRVHEQYQSFFPPDVYYIADHAKRATSAYPLCNGHYYGVDYAARARHGVPAHERPRQFNPAGTYAANDLSWYANIPVPTSYMCMGSQEDFFGGYDHAARAGLVHVADHHIAPGKKQWTWGNHDFGYAWDRLLTDADGPYIELMAGVFTDNQPDFTFLQPGETKTFSQFWYPIREIGPAHHANIDAAVRLQIVDRTVSVAVAVTADHPDGVITLSDRTGHEIKRWAALLSPSAPFLETVAIAKGIDAESLTLEVRDAGQVLIRYEPKAPRAGKIPPAATEIPVPRDIASIDELYLAGVHLQQYRHATRMPEPYWQEALKRDPGDSRCNTATGNWRLRRGEFELACRHFRTAIARLTQRNPNPPDGEAFYGLGIALQFLGQFDDAYTAFSKACWSAAWQSAGHFALARLDARSKRCVAALDHLNRSLARDADHLKARNLKTIVLRKLGRPEEADDDLRTTRSRDALDFFARDLAGDPLHCDTQVRFDIALDYASAGLVADALRVLNDVTSADSLGSEPMLHYYRAYLSNLDGKDAAPHLDRAAGASPDYCFPARLEEITILEYAISARPSDARARYYLGNLLYDRKRYAEAIKLWEASARLDGSFPTVWRNLGIGYFNVLRQPKKALKAYQRAVANDPLDARLLYERDQLYKRVGIAPTKRLRQLLIHRDLVEQRDDLSIELCALLNQTGKHKAAQKIISTRQFQPWEGGEGQALQQHTRTHLALGQAALADGNTAAARSFFEHALTAPPNLGEARHLLANCSDVHYWIGIAADASGDRAQAKRHWTIAAEFEGDFQLMSVRAFSNMTYYSAKSLACLGHPKRAARLLHQLLDHARALERTPATIDYFATSLPTMLLFDEDLQSQQTIAARHMQALALHGLGKERAAQRLMKRVQKSDPTRQLFS
ncbi:MAG: DUF5107 domain-containing protein [Burkholderiales bacterium]|nr:DUF5107 domain-containing protein [Phycisphaerae bacterium]